MMHEKAIGPAPRKFAFKAGPSSGLICAPRRFFATFIAIVSFLSASDAARAQASACDLTGDGVVNAADVTLAVNMVLGLSSCTANILGAGVCDVLVVQRVVNVAVSGTCVAERSRTVSVTWTASVSTSAAGYNVYRAAQAGGPYLRLNSSQLHATAYTDYSVQAGQTYYYVATAVDATGAESAYSNEAQAAIPAN